MTDVDPFSLATHRHKVRPSGQQSKFKSHHNNLVMRGELLSPVTGALAGVEWVDSPYYNNLTLS